MLRTLFISLFIVPQIIFAAPTKVAIDTKSSTITWKGAKEFVDGAHTGTVAIKEGFLTLNGDKVAGGEFVIDMTSIQNTDLTDASMKTKLIGHLSSPDFFDTAKHKDAKFVITKVVAKSATDMMFEGSLTIRGKTNPMSIPAVVKKEGTAMVATGKIEFDRTKFDIKYSSKSAVPDLVRMAKDKIIKDNVALEFNVKTQI
jgi:polyisoprenoid-binding protein YceI